MTITYPLITLRVQERWRKWSRISIIWTDGWTKRKTSNVDQEYTLETLPCNCCTFYNRVRF